MQQLEANSLQIYQKYESLIYYTTNLLIKYPKHQRFFLSKQIFDTLYLGQRHMLYAEKEYSKTLKIKNLNELDICLSILKSHIRMSYKYKYISMNNYKTWSEKVTEICNMLGGWIKQCASR